MTSYDVGMGGGAVLRLTVTEASQDVAGNTSTDSWSLTLFKGSFSSFSFTPIPWSVSINGVGYGGSFTFDFRSSSSVVVGSGSTVVPHNADGTKSTAVSGYIGDTGTSTGGPASNGGTFGQTTIPRASTPTFAIGGSPVTACDAGVALTINTNRASSGFTHTLEYSIGADSGTIATGVGASTTWTPPLSLLNQIPAAVAAPITITCKTYSGATLIGTKTTTFSLTVPSSIVPDFTTVTHAEAVTLVATEVGAYVQGLSKLALAITDAAGAYSSTIVGYSISVAGQTIAAVSGTTPAAIAASGTVTITGVVTDSRGRTRTRTVDVTVLAYVIPSVSAFSLQRSSVGGTPDEEGTYLRVNLTAAAQSLVNSTQRNELSYRISTRPRGDTDWDVIETVDTGAVTFASFDTVGTYATTGSWEVLVEVFDKFTTVALGATVATSAIFMHWGASGVGFGKYHEFGALDVAGAIFAEGVDVRRAATDTLDGVTRFATNAETLTGTADGIAVTPEGFQYALEGRLAAGLFDSRYFTESEIATKLENGGWERVVPSAIASSGATATMDATTGIVTCPVGCTMVRLDGVFAAGYEYMVESAEVPATGTSVSNQMYVRFCASGTPNTTAAYYTVGRYVQYDGTNGLWIVNAGNVFSWGIGGSAGRARRAMEIYSPFESIETFVKHAWNYSTQAARETTMSGSFNGSASFDGIQVFPSAGSFSGTLRVLRRKVL